MTEIKHGKFGSVGQPNEEKKMNVTDLRSLVELGCVRDSKNIGGFVFDMRSLSALEKIEATSFVTGDDMSPTKAFDFNVLLLSMSIESVNGAPLESLYEGVATDNILKARQSVIRQLQSSVITELMNFHNEITQRSDALFSAEQVKN